MIDCVMLSAKWYAEWMPKLKGEFEAQNLTSPAIKAPLTICCTSRWWQVCRR